MVFDNAVPQAGDDLSVSQLDLLNNNISLNSTYGFDHYQFIDTTGNAGAHKKVTTPTFGSHPAASSTQDVFYGMQDSANLGILQYSRGWDSANSTSQVPTPLTSKHSTSTPLSLASGASTPIFDFSGLSKAICTVYAYDAGSSSKIIRTKNEALIFWTSTSTTSNTSNVVSPTTQSALKLTVSAGVITLTNDSNTSGGSSINLTDLYWTIHFHRVQT